MNFASTLYPLPLLVARSFLSERKFSVREGYRGHCYTRWNFHENQRGSRIYVIPKEGGGSKETLHQVVDVAESIDCNVHRVWINRRSWGGELINGLIRVEGNEIIYKRAKIFFQFPEGKRKGLIEKVKSVSSVM